MPNAELTDFTEQLRTHNPFDERVDACPFCGEVVEEPLLEGVNCQVCLLCGEALQYYTPSRVTVHGETTLFDIWSYIPIEEEWERNSDAVFLEPSTGELSYKELSSQEKEIVRAVGRKNDLIDVTGLTKIPRPDPDLLQSLTEHLPRPTIFAGHTVYTVNSDRVQELVSKTPAATSQTSLTTTTPDSTNTEQ